MRGELLRHERHHVADGCFGAAHDRLHAANGAEKVSAIDHVLAAGADENVLVVARDADDLVRHELPDRENAIPSTVGDARVDLATDGIVEATTGYLPDEIRRN